MRNKFGLKVLAISIALVIVASGVAMYGYSGTGGGEGISESGGGKGVISLVAPPFIGVAGAAEATGGDAFPEDEAGISAYVNVGQPIDLEQVASIFDQINETSATHVIGMVPIPNFDGADISHVHLYADINGWIVAYAENDEPASLMAYWDVDKENPSMTEVTNAFEYAIEKACNVSSIEFSTIQPNIKYYDFEFPDATNVALFFRLRATDGSNYTHVAVPNKVYEAAYSHYVWGHDSQVYHRGHYYWYYHDTWSRLKVDGKLVNELHWGGGSSYGLSMNITQYPNGTIVEGMPHTIEIYHDCEENDYGSSGVATVIIYKSE